MQPEMSYRSTTQGRPAMSPTRFTSRSFVNLGPSIPRSHFADASIPECACLHRHECRAVVKQQRQQQQETKIKLNQQNGIIRLG